MFGRGCVFDLSGLVLVCGMRVSEVWRALRAVAEMEGVHILVTMATMTIYTKHPPPMQLPGHRGVDPFGCYDSTVVMSFRF